SNHFSFSLAAFLQPLRNTVRAVIGHSLSHDTRLLCIALHHVTSVIIHRFYT
ncbi:unnamed protein product, partial [Staurois parvus]